MHSSRLDEPTGAATMLRALATILVVLAIGLVIGGGIGVMLAKLLVKVLGTVAQQLSG